MSINTTNMYGVDAHVAEVYDQRETQARDVELLRRLIGGRGPLRILEGCCGTGRILIPLAMGGHTVVGMDQSAGMLARAQRKIAALPLDVRQRITLIEGDITAVPWPSGVDLVALAGNCFYELATPGEQEGCIAAAAASLAAGGVLCLDNDHMEGDLDESWRRPGVQRGAFPTGTCADGARVESTNEAVWVDVPNRLWRARRSTTVSYPDGTVVCREYVQQKHPVSVSEQQAWLARHGFVVEAFYGDHAGGAFTDASTRGIFWAVRR